MLLRCLSFCQSGESVFRLSSFFSCYLHFPPFVLTFAWPGGACIRFPFFFFPLSFPPVRAFRLCETGRTALSSGPSGLPGAALSGSRPGPAASFPSLSGVSSRPRRARYSFRPVGGCKAFPVFPEFRAIPFPPAPFRPFRSRGPRPRIYYYKVQPRFSCPFLSNIRKSFHFPSFFSFESLAVRDILVTFALAFGNDVPPGRRVSPANEERVL